tara:strand:+ start:967 stop:1224 length:258 start_codon:yes stop_codon:yes gene_type:complete
MIPAGVLGLNKFLPHHIVIFLIFSVLYHTLKQEEDKESLKSFEDALYFSVVTHFTVGFGDISPKSSLLRRLSMLQILLAFVFFAS